MIKETSPIHSGRMNFEQKSNYYNITDSRFMNEINHFFKTKTYSSRIDGNLLRLEWKSFFLDYLDDSKKDFTVTLPRSWSFSIPFPIIFGSSSGHAGSGKTTSFVDFINRVCDIGICSPINKTSDNFRTILDYHGQPFSHDFLAKSNTFHKALSYKAQLYTAINHQCAILENDEDLVAKFKLFTEFENTNDVEKMEKLSRSVWSAVFTKGRNIAILLLKWRKEEFFKNKLYDYRLIGKKHETDEPTFRFLKEYNSTIDAIRRGLKIQKYAYGDIQTLHKVLSKKKIECLQISHSRITTAEDFRDFVAMTSHDEICLPLLSLYSIILSEEDGRSSILNLFYLIIDYFCVSEIYNLYSSKHRPICYISSGSITQSLNIAKTPSSLEYITSPISISDTNINQSWCSEYSRRDISNNVELSDLIQTFNKIRERFLFPNQESFLMLHSRENFSENINDPSWKKDGTRLFLRHAEIEKSNRQSVKVHNDAIITLKDTLYVSSDLILIDHTELPRMHHNGAYNINYENISSLTPNEATKNICDMFKLKNKIYDNRSIVSTLVKQPDLSAKVKFETHITNKRKREKSNVNEMDESKCDVTNKLGIIHIVGYANLLLSNEQHKMFRLYQRSIVAHLGDGKVFSNHAFVTSKSPDQLGEFYYEPTSDMVTIYANPDYSKSGADFNKSVENSIAKIEMVMVFRRIRNFIENSPVINARLYTQVTLQGVCGTLHQIMHSVFQKTHKSFKFLIYMGVLDYFYNNWLPEYPDTKLTINPTIYENYKFASELIKNTNDVFTTIDNCFSKIYTCVRSIYAICPDFSKNQKLELYINHLNICNFISTNNFKICMSLPDLISHTITSEMFIVGDSNHRCFRNNKFEKKYSNKSSSFTEKYYMDNPSKVKYHHIMKWATEHHLPHIISDAECVLKISEILIVSTNPSFQNIDWRKIFKTNQTDRFGVLMRKYTAPSTIDKSLLHHRKFISESYERDVIDRPFIENSNCKAEKNTDIVVKGINKMHYTDKSYDFNNIDVQRLIERDITGCICAPVISSNNSTFHYEQGNTRNNQCVFDVGKLVENMQHNSCIDLESMTSALLVGLTRNSNLNDLHISNIDQAKKMLILHYGESQNRNKFTQKHTRSTICTKYEKFR